MLWSFFLGGKTLGEKEDKGERGSVGGGEREEGGSRGRIE